MSWKIIHIFLDYIWSSCHTSAIRGIFLLLKFLRFVWILLLTLVSSLALMGCLSWYGHRLLSEMKFYQNLSYGFCWNPMMQVFHWILSLLSSGFSLYTLSKPSVALLFLHIIWFCYVLQQTDEETDVEISRD